VPRDKANRSNSQELLFRVSVWLKGLDGALEALGGIALWFLNPAWITDIAMVVTWNWIAKHPHHAVAQHLYNSAQHFSAGSERFAAIYLFIHGIVKIGLVAGLLKRQRWTYPTALVVFVAFVVYQIYRYQVTHAILLIPLTIFDLIVIWLIWREYRRLTGESRAGSRAIKLPAK
jgi:uncharacterized membrane protein